MPTKYKATIDHKPLDWSTDFAEIEKFMLSHGDAIAEALVPESRRPLDKEDRDQQLSEITWILVGFAARCAALPLRSVNMLKATVQAIAQGPERFRECVDAYDPEAVCMVADAFARMSTAHKRIWTGFELGTGPHPDPVDIREAAQRVMRDLNPARKGGRTADELQSGLAEKLGEIFVRQGGRISRETHDGETGPFHELLKLVLPAVRPYAFRAGSSLGIRTMVQKAQKSEKKRLGRPQEENEGYPVNCIQGDESAPY